MSASGTQDALFGGVYSGKTVLVTGHTGFKGSWLTLWLQRLGARVVGLSLDPPTTPSLFEAARLSELVSHHVTDVRDREAVARIVAQHQPEIVFHLAAQSLVRPSYQTPFETFDVNVMGTAAVLDAVRACPSVRATVVVSSDKCYENREWDYAYRENDPMGGWDPYSASKGCAELVVASYRRSFFGPDRGLASARAGNVMGGGDWAAERIVPDCVRALSAGLPISLRHPGAVRPWQHVLEPLAGYMWLGARLFEAPAAFSDAWNFGPGPRDCVSVREVVERAIAAWGEGAWVAEPQAGAPHEAHLLKLDVAKTTHRLGWAPVYTLEEAVEATIAWYRTAHQAPTFDARAHTLAQVAAYEALAAERGAAWAIDASRKGPA